MRYANHECAKCGVILPTNELTTVTDQVATGSTSYSRRVNGTLRPGGQSRHVAIRHRRLCPKCLTKRRLGQLAIGLVAAMLFAPAYAIPLLGAGAVLFLIVALRNWLGLVLVAGAAAVGAVWLISGHSLGALGGVESAIANVAARARISTPGPGPVEARPSDAEVGDSSAVLPSHTRHAASAFGAAQPVIQKLPPARTAAYPRCSATITDHCVER